VPPDRFAPVAAPSTADSTFVAADGQSALTSLGLPRRMSEAARTSRPRLRRDGALRACRNGWRIRLPQQLKDLIVPRSPPGYVAMPEAMRLLGVSRQTIMQRVKRGELPVVHVSRGKQKGLRIRVLDYQPQLFDPPAAARV
jgi:hypothetical protein